MSDLKRVSILGAGAGGCSAAVDLTQRGFEVRLYSRSEERLRPLVDLGGIGYTGVFGDGRASVECISSDLHEVVPGADVVLICAPMLAHVGLATAAARLMGPDTPLLLTPGHLALAVPSALRAAGQVSPLVCETVTLPYAARMVNPTTVRASLRVKDLPFAAFPAVRTTDVLERIRPLFPQLIPLRDLLHVTFLYTNAVHHPPATICNAGRIEDTAGNYLHYYEGITPSVGRVIDAVDLERRSVAQAYYVDTPTFVDRFVDMGYTTEEARRTGLAYEAFHASEPDRWIQAPESLVHRFLDEDVPYGLVPLAALARVAQIGTPNIDALIQIASTLRGVDYLAEGMGVDRLGIANLSHGDLQAVLWEGFR